MKRIVVTGNCQAESLANALKIIYPGTEVNILPFIASPESSLEWSKNYKEVLTNADVWLIMSAEWGDKVLEALGIGSIKRFVYPNLEFRGFFPDQCHALSASGNGVDPVYQSAIVLCCYKNEVNVRLACDLFVPQTFERLGYIGMWERAVSLMIHHFSFTDMKGDFQEYFRHVQRFGVFMHTINHPKVEAIVFLAKLIAIHLGKSRDVLKKHIRLPDLLDSTIWPIYPSLGNSFGCGGSLDFIWSGRPLSLREYVEMSYSRLCSMYPQRTDVRIATAYLDQSKLESVLINEVERNG